MVVDRPTNPMWTAVTSYVHAWLDLKEKWGNANAFRHRRCNNVLMSKRLRKGYKLAKHSNVTKWVSKIGKPNIC